MSEPTKPNDGGPFFPVPGFTDDPGNPGRTIYPENGASTRLVIAMHLLEGVITSYGPKIRGKDKRDDVSIALEYADELMRQAGA